MNKLKLRLDDLRVDTFQTASAQKEKGTVFGEQSGATCMADFGTCAYSCKATCHGSCPPGTCYFSCPVIDTCYMGAC
jgi:hypothetical protein